MAPRVIAAIRHSARGYHTFDGWHALAYARSRHQDNDYNRMKRQQEVLRALPRSSTRAPSSPHIPELLDIARQSLWTNVPVEQLPDLFEIGARVNPTTIASYQFWPPDIHERLDVESINRVRLMVRTAFSEPPSPTPGPSSSATSAPTAPGSIC